MSLFRRFIRSKSLDIEKTLEDSYVQMLQASGMEEAEAKRTVRDAISMCKLRGQEEGTSILPEKSGDLLVSQAAKGKAEAIVILQKARKEGATDEDIVEWWNLSDLQRRMVLWSEDSFRYATFAKLSEDGLDGAAASKKVRQIFPMYGDPDDLRHTSGDDRPLPHELRGRVDRYYAKRGAAQVQQQSSRFSTCNAFIRAEIRSGRL